MSRLDTTPEGWPSAASSTIRWVTACSDISWAARYGDSSAETTSGSVTAACSAVRETPSAAAETLSRSETNPTGGSSGASVTATACTRVPGHDLRDVFERRAGDAADDPVVHAVNDAGVLSGKRAGGTL